MEIKPGHLEAIHITFKELERRWTPPTPDASVFHAYDPLPVALFYPGINAIEDAENTTTFLDVGCGIGTKLSLMFRAGYKVSGIEHYPPYLAVAQELIPEADLFQASILDIDDFDADIVYMYRPAVKDSLEEELENHVVEHMRFGSFLFLPCREIERDDLTKLSENVWVKT